MVSVLLNAKIVTLNPAQTEAEAIAIENGRILAVGTQDAVLAAVDSAANKLDMQGLTIVPGFNDCHMHILPYGLDLAQADLSPAAGVADVAGLIGNLKAWCRNNVDSEWALGNRYDQNIFPNASHPTRRELDAAFPDQPVYVLQTSKHAGAANSVALRLAGIGKDTPNPEGGEIVRDSSGEPTGVLLESAMGLVSRCIPKPDKSGLTAAVRTANEVMVKAGITSASDLNTGWLNMEMEIGCYLQAAREGAPIRTTLFPHAPCFGGPGDIPARSDFEATNFSEGADVRMGAIKLFSDGALTVRTAALREPYIDGSGSGMLLHPPDELRAYIMAAHKLGWQVAVHAIGDRAVELVLDGFNEAQKAYLRANCRHRIEHAMIVDDGLIQRFADQEVIPVVQPEFVSRLGDAYVLGLGEARAARLNPNATMQRAGLPVPFSSDCPIVPGAPLDGIRAAFHRTTRKGTVLGAKECVSPMDGLLNYTYWAAYSSFDEAETGTLERGKRADLAVLNQVLSEEHLDTVSVVATMIAGQFVFGREQLQ